MRDLAVLFLHLLATVARLAGPGGARSVVAESVLVKQQLLILNRSRKRSPHLRFSDRVVAGVCAILMSPGRLIRSAIVLKPVRGASWALACTAASWMASGCAGCSIERREATPRRHISARTMMPCMGSSNGERICESST